jgi:nicotinamide mononucleotide transporter
MSIYGWYKWSRKTSESDNLPITRTNKKRKMIGILLFLVTIFVVFRIYKVFNYEIHNDNYIDIVASGIFFTGMWYMAQKK